MQRNFKRQEISTYLELDVSEGGSVRDMFKQTQHFRCHNRGDWVHADLERKC